ncbi:coenzyme Q-binding protein COQ10, partial [Lecanoromycetidae sp. Uapishka_2]
MKSSPQLLRLLRPTSALPKPESHLSRAHTAPTLPLQRQFVSNPLTPLQTLHASRILTYHAAPLYDLIADISAYPEFIPYCTSSSITSQSAIDSKSSRRWPRTADLRIGYGPYDELFRSAVYCLPYTILEAVAGDAESSIPRSQLPHYYGDPDREHDAEKSAGNASIFTSLLTRWTFKEFPFKPTAPDGKSPQEGNASQPSTPRTEVNLTLEVRFASAVYSALSQAAAPKVAGIMIDAFEKRAAQVLGGKSTQYQSRAEIEGQEGALDGVTRGKQGIMG